jgi:hypothetical protein
MSDKQTFDEKHNQHQYYEIRLKGHLDDRWAEWFEGLTITLEKCVIWACHWSQSVLLNPRLLPPSGLARWISQTLNRKWI